MSNLDRLKILIQFSEEEPSNPFNWYALALEYLSIDSSKTEDLYDKLLNEHEGYLPTYYPAAHFFAEREKLGKAQAIFEKGIHLAKSQNESKTEKELKSAFEMFLFENDLD